jgi:ATP-binding cassette subfamily C protein CydC
LLIGMILAGIALPLVTLWLARKTSHRQVAVRSTLQQHLVDSLAGMEDMLALGIEQTREKDYGRMTTELTFLQRRQAQIGAFHNSLCSLLSWGTVTWVLLTVIPKIQTGEFSGLLLAAAAFGVLASFEATQPLPAAYQYLEQASEASRRIYEIIEERPDVSDPHHPIPIPEKPSFAFRDVSFTFRGSSRRALSDISFEVPFGSRIAILGPSGAGKSSIVHLLCRFSDPQKGTVLLGGHSLAAYSVEDIRRQLAVVLQHPHIFNTGIRENLLLAQPEAKDSELMDALDRAGLASFVQGLPQGLDTIAGLDGLRLSGGQRQRLALAQALLKNAPILILDEATASLDLKTEREVLDSVNELTADRTLVVISHRPEVLTGMDAVLTLRDGRLEGADVKSEKG